MAKKLKAVKANENGQVEGDGQESDIPGLKVGSSSQARHAPVLESVPMEADGSSSSAPTDAPKGPRAMTQKDGVQDDEQKKAMQAAYNKKKQAAKANSMFIKKKVGVWIS